MNPASRCEAPLIVIIPTLNEAAHLPALLASLTSANPTTACTIIISDGGSTDATRQIAQQAGAHLIDGPPGRGGQFQRGIALGQSINPESWLWLLHADSALPPNWPEAVRAAYTHPNRAYYGRLRFDSADPRARLLELGVRLRCALFALPYGDQSLLIHPALLTAIGGMPGLPLMEDVALAQSLGRRRLAPLDLRITTDPSAYLRDGWLRRAVQNLTRLLRFLRTPHTPLAADYRR
jgi:glycosyltransferase involved in cell wall biosynthesis